MRAQTLSAITAICFWATTCHAAVLGTNEFDAAIGRGRAAFAASDFQAALQFYEIACAAENLGTGLLARTALCEHQLATVAAAKGDRSGAERHYLLAVEAWQQSGPKYANSWTATLLNLGELYRTQQRMDEAERTLLRASGLSRQVAAEQPELYPEALSRLGVVYQETSRFDAARTAFTQALTRFAGLTPPIPAEEAYAWNGLGMVQLAAGIQPEAEEHLRRAVTLASASLGEDHAETAAYQTNLALSLIAQGKFERAGALLRRAKLVVDRQPVAADNQVGLILAEMSAAAAGENKFALAENYAKQALQVLSRQKEPNATAIALAKVNLADVYVRSRRLNEADALLPGAIATERLVAADSRLLADGLRRFGDLRANQHAWREAQDLYREAIGLYERKLGVTSPALAPALRGYADALKHGGGSKSEIRTLESRAKAVSGFLPRT